MICKCGADMRHQSQGVWFCSRGDRFAVVINQEAQWFSAEGEPGPYRVPTGVELNYGLEQNRRDFLLGGR